MPALEVIDHFMPMIKSDLYCVLFQPDILNLHGLLDGYSEIQKFQIWRLWYFQWSFLEMSKDLFLIL